MKRLLTRDDVATLFSVTTTTIDRWAKSGRLPQPHKIGRTVRWTRRQLEHLLK